MTDVRLTALNPEDSQVYPVACNSSGELLIDKGEYVKIIGDNMTGDLTLGTDKITLNQNGSAVFESSVNGSAFYSLEPTGTSALAKLSWFHFYLVDSAGDKTVEIKNDGSITAAGSAQFAGDVIVGSRSKQWMLVEQGGLCHMVEQTRRVTKDLVNSEYPKLRDVFQELNLIEEALSEVMEKLRLTPPAGWPVWDGSDETQ